jgi:hypothetical protein
VTSGVSEADSGGMLHAPATLPQVRRRVLDDNVPVGPDTASRTNCSKRFVLRPCLQSLPRI